MPRACLPTQTFGCLCLSAFPILLHLVNSTLRSNTAIPSAEKPNVTPSNLSQVLASQVTCWLLQLILCLAACQALCTHDLTDFPPNPSGHRNKHFQFLGLMEGIPAREGMESDFELVTSGSPVHPGVFPLCFVCFKGFYFCLFVAHATQHVGSQFPDQGSNLHLLYWKRGVLTTVPPGKSLHLRFVSFYNVFNKVTCVRAKLLQWCPTLCDPVDRSPPGSSVHGILQARILEWVAMPSSKGSS